MQAVEINETVESNPQLVNDGQEMLNAVLGRSSTDMVFRKKLVSDPRAAIAEFTGRAVAPSFNVTFVENLADATIVLPDPIDAETELSEQDLETVAGGSEIVATILCAIASAIALTRAIAR